ncbi:hypothetical protein C2S52_023217 [Perilla frutescens var. hirtella]|nr:hypothetical protein C2S52_023217 [Perilla frutescens var. hirtella]
MFRFRSLLLISFLTAAFLASALGEETLFPASDNSSGEEVNTTLILAAKRTQRRDPLDNFHDYRGGWNISNRHYWASVAYTAVPFFVVAAIWFVIFGLCLTIICLCFCCCRREPYGYSRLAYALSLVFLTFFTIAAIVGCVILYTGQGKFHSSTINTLEYVVYQADTTSERDWLLSYSLLLCFFSHFSDSVCLFRFLEFTRYRKFSIVILLHFYQSHFWSFAVSVFSIFGMQVLVYLMVITGWILVTGTFVLCGVFLLLHKYVYHDYNRGHSFTLMNTVITNIANQNNIPSFLPIYYNQSGPLVPNLCNPFSPDLSDRACAPGEVDLNNATQVWGGYVCQTSGNGRCTTTGRLTPSIYGQMTAGVNVSYGLYRYGPFLVNLEDCTFVRQTFTAIETSHCPGLRKYSQWIYIGLVMVAVAVMLSLLFWVIYGRERRHRVYTKAHPPREAPGFDGDKHG